MLKRLTVHLDKVKKERVETGFDVKRNKPSTKSILTNTLSVRKIIHKTVGSLRFISYL